MDRKWGQGGIPDRIIEINAVFVLPGNGNDVRVIGEWKIFPINRLSVESGSRENARGILPRVLSVYRYEIEPWIGEGE